MTKANDKKTTKHNEKTKWQKTMTKQNDKYNKMYKTNIIPMFCLQFMNSESIYAHFYEWIEVCPWNVILLFTVPLVFVCLHLE